MTDFRRGIWALDRGDHEAAVGLFSAHASSHPTDWKALLWQARAEAEAGRADDALAHLRMLAERPQARAVARSFAAVILLDFERFREARDEASLALQERSTALAEGIRMLAEVWLGGAPPERMIKVLQAANADLKGRALHLVETRSAALTGAVTRDLMDEVGIGWPMYRVPPPWLFKTGAERSIWHKMARGLTDEAFQEASTWAAESRSDRRAPSMVAAAMMAGRWGEALSWAELIPHYRAFNEGTIPRRSLNHFQVALFRGVCTLMRGNADRSITDLAQAARLDGTSYLPRYSAGRAYVALGRWTEPRREFVAACERLNPALAVVRWRELRRAD